MEIIKKIYLAIPYMGPKGQEERNFQIANNVAGHLMREGYIVFSPISHSHPITRECELPKDWNYWKEVDTEFIKWCDALYVIFTSKEEILASEGVIAEIKIAEELNKEIVFVNINCEIIKDNLEIL